MTKYGKEQIAFLRSKGESYKKIADTLNISINTVKSHCRRYISNDDNKCDSCGIKLINIPGKREKRFCSDKCRMAWWNKNRKGNNEFICLICGKRFKAYASRKYCSKACYGKSKAVSQ